MSGGWTVLCPTSDVLPGESHVAWFGDVPLVIVNFDGIFYALEDRCTHEDFELSAGPYDAATGQIECVLHGALFDVRSGEAPSVRAASSNPAAWVRNIARVLR